MEKHQKEPEQSPLWMLLLIPFYLVWFMLGFLFVFFIQGILYAGEKLSSPWLKDTIKPL